MQRNSELKANGLSRGLCMQCADFVLDCHNSFLQFIYKTIFLIKKLVILPLTDDIDCE